MCGQDAPASPFAIVNLTALVPKKPEVFSAGTIVFLTNATVAVSACWDLECNLLIFGLECRKPRLLAQKGPLNYYEALFRAPGGSVLLSDFRTATDRGAALFDPQLREVRRVSKLPVTHTHISETGETLTRQLAPNQWAVYRMGAPHQRILEGSGLLLSVSDNAVAYLDQGRVRIEDLGGKALGSFAGGDSHRSPSARFIGKDRIWYQDNSDPELRDFEGNVVQKLAKPDGWGFRFGQSTDGSSILYDRYTRHVSAARSATELALATAIGDAADQEANGELVQVINARKGKSCFEWRGRAGILLAGGYHADIDPTGRFVAIMTQRELQLYSLPETCTAK